MSVYLFGDYHANVRNEREYLENNEMKEGDILIILGDVGLLRYFPHESRYEKDIENRDYFGKQKYETFCIMGNHENWILYKDLPEEKRYEGKVKVLETKNKKIYIAITGENYKIQGKYFFVINGASSVDKFNSTENIDWFKEENISYQETNKVLEKIEEIGYKTDYLLTHTTNNDITPYFAKNKTYQEKCPTAEFIAYIDTILKYKENHFGHFHIEKKIEKNNKIYYCHYKSKPYKLF